MPLDPALVEDFDPETVPTVAQLYAELEASAGKGTARGMENMNTSMATARPSTFFFLVLAADSDKTRMA